MHNPLPRCEEAACYETLQLCQPQPVSGLKSWRAQVALDGLLGFPHPPLSSASHYATRGKLRVTFARRQSWHGRSLLNAADLVRECSRISIRVPRRRGRAAAKASFSAELPPVSDELLRAGTRRQQRQQLPPQQRADQSEHLDQSEGEVWQLSCRQLSLGSVPIKAAISALRDTDVLVVRPLPQRVRPLCACVLLPLACTDRISRPEQSMHGADVINGLHLPPGRAVIEIVNHGFDRSPDGPPYFFVSCFERHLSQAYAHKRIILKKVLRGNQSP